MYSAHVSGLSDWLTLFVVVILVIFAGLFWPIAQSRGARVGRTRVTQPRHEANPSALIRPFPFRGFPTLGRPQTGDQGSLGALIRARRFKDASAVVSPDDRHGRTTLAIARLGPAVDLYRDAIAPFWSRNRRKARFILTQFYPELGISVPSILFWRFDAVQNYMAVLERHARHRRFNRAGRGYEALARKYPKADDSPVWMLTGAFAYGLAGLYDDAKRLALLVIDAFPQHPASEAASKYLRRLEHAGEDTKLRWNPQGATRDAFLRRQLSAAKSKQFPIWPAQIARIMWRHGFTTELADFTPENVAAILDGKATPWVVLTSGPRLFIRAITTLSVGLGVVGLSDGSLLTWDDLVSRSLWGNRLAVVRSTTLAVTWTTIDRDSVTDGPPLGSDGAETFDAAELQTMRGRAKQYPDDPSVALGYVRTLLWCPLGSEDEHQRNNELRQAAAVARLRFGEYKWARYEWARVSDEYAADPDLQALGGLDSLAENEPWGIVNRALARAEPAAAHCHLREAALLEPFHGMTLGRLLETAERNGDAAEYDVVLRYIDKVIPNDPAGPRNRWRRLVLQHGPRDAFPLVTPDLGGNAYTIAQTKAALAAHASDPDLLQRAADEADAVMPADPTAALCRVLCALHRSDADDAVSRIDEVIARHGLSQMTSLALLDVANGLKTSPEASAILARADRCMDTHPWSVRGLVVELRATHLWREGLEMGRRLVHSNMLSAPATTAMIEGILHALEIVESDERSALVEEGAGLLKRVPEVELGPGARHMKAALERFRDPRRAWKLLREADVASMPLVSLALAVEISEAQGDSEQAHEYRTRMANPDLIVGGMSTVSRLGLAHAVEGALADLDPDLFPHAVYDLYSAGGSVPRLPQVPISDYTNASIQLLDRLARNAEWNHLKRLHAARFIARSFLGFEDGAYGAALGALASAGLGNRSELSALSKRSHHPAILRALAIAETNGLGFVGARARAAELAPGTIEDLDFMGVDR